MAFKHLLADFVLQSSWMARGKERISIWGGILPLERDLQRAQQRRKFVLFFQPIVHLRSRVLPGMRAALARQGGAEPLFVSVNVSGHDLAQSGYGDGMRTLLRTTGIAPGSLEIEV